MGCHTHGVSRFMPPVKVCAPENITVVAVKHYGDNGLSHTWGKQVHAAC